MSHSVLKDTASTGRFACELADIVREHGAAYRQTHRLRATQRKALWCIEHCRTEAVGGHRYWCRRCGYERHAYHSCRNRHCPKCQTMTTAAWVAARQQEVLPVPYFHNVFTLPHELNALILYTEHNQRVLLDLLFDSAAQTLLEFGKNELGGKVGFTLVLHTWDQRLRPHFHLHCPIASGALSEDGSRWIAGGSQYLFAVRALSKVYRGKYLDGLTRLLAQGDLDLPSQLRQLSNADSRRRWLRRLWKKSWAVYSKAPFAGPRKLMDYLGRYTHKVAISNHRLVACQNGEVTFRYRDRADGDRVKHETLPAEEFLDRFLKHILPDEFRRVRHYGLLSNRDKHKRLARCRELLGYGGSRQPDDVPTNSAEWMLELLGVDIYCCPRCNEPLRCEQLPAVGGEVDSSEVPAPFPEFEAWDTS